ncbi:hypothetical protein HK104_009741 [Borealophlyctis nickersoniae]|nr:hypothetical protein HK104_009741 [Borealophlyctis nickersoniae]
MAAAASSRKTADDILPLFCDPDMRICSFAGAGISMDGVSMILPPPTKCNGMAATGAYDEEEDTPWARPMNSPAPVADWEELLAPSPAAPDQGCPELHTLNLYFCTSIPGIPFSLLLSHSIPLLSSLAISGCFDATQGPSALNILARNLINLRTLEARDLPWATVGIIMGIGWDAHWKLVGEVDFGGCAGVGGDELRRVMRRGNSAMPRKKIKI